MTTISLHQAKLNLIENVRDLAYLFSKEAKFSLASGRQSSHFFDMKPVMMDPESAHLLGILIHFIIITKHIKISL